MKYRLSLPKTVSKFCQIFENIIMCDKSVFVSWIAVYYWCCLRFKTSVIYDF
jgi:hypothetical protein